MKIVSNILNKKTLISCALLLAILFIALSPPAYIAASLDGLILWASVVLPSLLPFIFFTKLLTEFGAFKSFKSPAFEKLYNVPSIALYAFIVSIMSGYPVGAKVVSDLYENRSITKEEAFRITTFTSNSGPMFIIGSVGVGMLLSRACGYIMLVSHILGALLNGLIYRNHKEKIFEAQNVVYLEIKKPQNLLADVMWNTVSSCLLVGGYIAVFFVIGELLYNLKIFAPISMLLEKFGVSQSITNAVLYGLLEMTRGCQALASVAELSLTLKTVLATGLITFGGISTMLQANCFLKKFGMTTSFFLKQKTTHALISMGMSLVLSIIFL